MGPSLLPGDMNRKDEETCQTDLRYILNAAFTSHYQRKTSVLPNIIRFSGLYVSIINKDVILLNQSVFLPLWKFPPWYSVWLMTKHNREMWKIDLWPIWRGRMLWWVRRDNHLLKTVQQRRRDYSGPTSERKTWRERCASK